MVQKKKKNTKTNKTVNAAKKTNMANKTQPVKTSVLESAPAQLREETVARKVFDKGSALFNATFIAMASMIVAYASVKVFGLTEEVIWTTWGFISLLGWNYADRINMQEKKDVSWVPWSYIILIMVLHGAGVLMLAYDIQKYDAHKKGMYVHGSKGFLFCFLVIAWMLFYAWG